MVWFEGSRKDPKEARSFRYSHRGGGGAHHSPSSSPVVLPCRPSHPDFNVTIRQIKYGPYYILYYIKYYILYGHLPEFPGGTGDKIPGMVAAAEADAGFAYFPSEGFVVPGSDVEDRDG